MYISKLIYGDDEMRILAIAHTLILLFILAFPAASPVAAQTGGGYQHKVAKTGA